MNENTDNKEKLSIVNCQLSIEQFLKKDEEKDLLRFLTAGSVDDGKSTLIGRLLFDSKKYRLCPLARRIESRTRTGHYH